MKKHRRLKKYAAKKSFPSSLHYELESILATLEILSECELTARLISLSRAIDADVAAGHLLMTAEVFGKKA